MQTSPVSAFPYHHDELDITVDVPEDYELAVLSCGLVGPLSMSIINGQFLLRDKLTDTQGRAFYNINFRMWTNEWTQAYWIPSYLFESKGPSRILDTIYNDWQTSTFFKDPLLRDECLSSPPDSPLMYLCSDDESDLELSSEEEETEDPLSFTPCTCSYTPL